MKHRKIILFLVLLFFTSSIFQLISLQTTYGISNVQVSVVPDIINQYGEYTISFITGATLTKDTDKITIYFPSGTTLPCGCSGVGWNAQDFVVNGITLSSTPSGSDTERFVIITVPLTIGAGSNVSIKIKSTAWIKNPPNPGYYTLKVTTSKETNLVESNQYYIGYSKISNVKVYLDNPVQGVATSFKIRFNTGLLGALTASSSKIYVELPNFTLPPFINGNFVLVNNISVSQSGQNGVSISGNKLTIPVPVNIDRNSQVEIYFSERANIINPSSPGRYKATVYTSEETSPVDSDEFLVTPTPSVSTSVIVLPTSDPTGNNGYYTSPISVILIGNSNSGANVTVHYSVDGSNFLAVTGQPARIELSDGIHVIKFYSEDSNGAKEEVREKEFKVDSTPPNIILTDPQGDIVVSKFNYTIKGKIENYDTNTVLYINGKQVTVDQNGQFSFDVSLLEGDNQISIVAVDEAGNKSEKDLVIKVSTVVPKITILQPSDWQAISDNFVTVVGKVDIESTVTVNDVEVNLAQDGSFSYTFSLDGFSKGLIPIKIVAKAKESGLSSSKVIVINYTPKPKEIVLKLVINSNIALKNGESIILDSPPFIDPKTNRTLVPIRFISEAFGADVQWDGISRVVTVSLNNRVVKLQIGNNQALVDDKFVPLEQPPVIVKGRTFVPIRFIAETFGADVQWDGFSKTITIIYKLP